MPTIHNPDWNNLKLSDFPQFNCLCELCECGCFNRSKKSHASTCKKLQKPTSNAFETSNLPKFDSKSVYTDAFKKFEYETSNRMSTSHDSLKTTFPIHVKAKPSGNSISVPDKDAKVSSVTTNKEHFRSWKHFNPSQAACEHEEYAGGLIYPNDKRKFVTTNDELLFKNDYKNYQSKPNAFNVFENTFKLNQGKMNLDTVYNKEFDKKKLKNVKRDPLITKEHVEIKHAKYVRKIPMDLQTQTMLDYKYDPDSFRSASKLTDRSPANDLFRSKLNKNLYPNEFEDDTNYVTSIMNMNPNTYDTSYSVSYRDKFDAAVNANRPYDSTPPPNQARNSDEVPSRKLHTSSQPNMTHKKNIRFISTFNNGIVPTLKVIKKLPNGSQKLPPLDLTNSSQDFNDLNNQTYFDTTYRNDFKDKGMDVCMAKAYSVLLANMNGTNRSMASNV